VKFTFVYACERRNEKHVPFLDNESDGPVVRRYLLQIKIQAFVFFINDLRSSVSIVSDYGLDDQG
jgi:hypothetical protein